MSSIKVPVAFYYDRAIAIVKKARSQTKTANKFWRQAEERNAPLWKENAELRDKVVKAEREIMDLRQQVNDLHARLDMITEAVSSPR